MKIEHHKTFMLIFPQKGAKVGKAVGKSQLFCIFLKVGSLDFFDILHEVKGP